MTNRESSKYEVLSSYLGKYYWYPSLLLVDFIPIGKRKVANTLNLVISRNTEKEATKSAVRHLSAQLIRD